MAKNTEAWGRSKAKERYGHVADGRATGGAVPERTMGERFRDWTTPLKSTQQPGDYTRPAGDSDPIGDKIKEWGK